MTLNEYQDKAMQTCMPSCKNITYMGWNLMGEVGEFAGKVAKHIRHESAKVDDNKLWFECDEAEYQKHMEALKLEAGDVLWQLAGLCKAMGWTLDEVATANLDKLRSRQQRGVIDGSGDYR